MKIVNKIGLEFEYFLVNPKTNTLVIPELYDLECDDFILLGEVRPDPGISTSEVIGNFYKALIRTRKLVAEDKLVMDFSGVKEITPQFKAEILRKIGTKEIAHAKNIYKTDILNLSDDVVEDGRVITCYVSTGLHVHFSRSAEEEWVDKDNRKQSSKINLLTTSQMFSIIRSMDKNILPKHNLGVNLKYRNPGFYELKSHGGFEYRSLPMYSNFLNLEELESLVDYSFGLLKKLDK